MVHTRSARAGGYAAMQGFVVLTGGHTGVMAAAAEGAHLADGLTIGMLKTDDHDDANEHIDIVIPTGMGIARNALTAMAADCIVALPGGLGTLQEASFALEYGRPVLSWHSNIELDGMDHARTEGDVQAWLKAQYETLLAAD